MCPYTSHGESTLISAINPSLGAAHSSWGHPPFFFAWGNTLIYISWGNYIYMTWGQHAQIHHIGLRTHMHRIGITPIGHVQHTEISVAARPYTLHRAARPYTSWGQHPHRLLDGNTPVYILRTTHLDGNTAISVAWGNTPIRVACGMPIYINWLQLVDSLGRN